MANCDLTYEINVQGDCIRNGNGSIEVQIFGNKFPVDYTIKWLSPYNDVIELGLNSNTYIIDNLSYGYYSFYILDTCEPVNNQVLVTSYVSSGNCASVSSVVHTTCGFNNGEFEVTVNNNMDNSTFVLYNEFNNAVETREFSSNLSERFFSLSAGTYYATVSDGYGCTAKTQTCIIKSSTTIDYDFYVVNDTGCPITGMGKIYITGLTGNPPYTYLWSNNQTGNFITGLTSGTYSVTVTDSTGCIVSKNVLVSDVPKLGFLDAIVTSPSCFQDNGTLEVYWSGGTSPYFYSGTNGDYGATFNSYATFNNLSSGPFSYHITDSGLCNFEKNFYLTSPEGFDNVSLTKINANCSNNGGKLTITLNGSSKNFTYELENEDGDSQIIETTSSTSEFNYLQPGTYTLTIKGGQCTYTETVVIENNVPFNVTTSITGGTCGQISGALDLVVSGATGPLSIDIKGENIDDQSFVLAESVTSTTVTNLASGLINYTVTDLGNDYCKVKGSLYMTNQPNVDFMFNKTNSTCGNGSICVSITSGEPTFTLDWSDNVNGQTGFTVTNLSAGTYSLTVTDSNGCKKTRSIKIDGTNSLSTYQVFNVCDNVFVNTGENIKKGPKEMLLEGYYDLISNDENCILNSAEFLVNVTVNGIGNTSSIYTTTSLDDYPTDQDFYDAVEAILINYAGIATVTIDSETNKITITTDCDSPADLSDAPIVVDLQIDYDISCVACNV
jgi:hypothetical protein